MIRIIKSTGEEFEEIDISDTGNEEEKSKMQEKVRSLGKSIVPPHIYRDNEYLGDYQEMFDAVESDDLKGFLAGAGR